MHMHECKPRQHEWLTADEPRRRRAQAMGLKVSFGCDRSQHSRPHSQKGFIEHMVTPLYAALGKVVPGEFDQPQAKLRSLLQIYAAQIDQAAAASK